MKQKIFLFFSVFICFILLLELLIRIGSNYNNANNGNCYRYDTVLHHIFISNSRCRQVTSDWDVIYKINSIGLRNNEITIPKPNDTFRILMLGDSFTEGKGVKLEETFSKQLEQLLNSSSSATQKFEVINAGIQSSSPILEYLLLKNKHSLLDSDLVIVNLDITDFFDEIGYTNDAVKNEQGEIIAVPYKNHSNFVDRINSAFLYFSKAYQGLSNWYPKVSRNFNLPGNDIGRISSDRFFMLRTNDVSNYRKYIDLLTNHLLLIKRYTDSINIELLVVVYPYGILVNETEWIGRTYWGFKLGQIYTTNLFDKLDNFAKEKKIQLLNVTDDLIKSQEHPLFFASDGHFTKTGHKIYANSIHNFITEHPEFIKP